jgi:hypothetical protein
MMNRRNALLGLVILLGTALAAEAQAPLQWRFRKNEEFYQETSATIKQTVTVAGQTQNQDFEQVTVSHYKVDQAVPEANTTILKQKIESVRINGTGPLASAAKAMEAMEGKVEFTITLDKNNQVQNIGDYEDFIKIVGKDDPIVSKSVRTMMSPDTLKKSIEESFTFLPAEPIAPGKSWTRESSMSLGPLGTVNAKHTYKYEGSENRNGRPLAKISVTATVTYQASKGEAASGLNFQVTKGELKAENAKGIIWFDTTAGRLVDSEMKMHLKGTLTISANGQDYPMELDQEQTVRVRMTEQQPVPAK